MSSTHMPSARRAASFDLAATARPQLDERRPSLGHATPSPDAFEAMLKTAEDRLPDHFQCPITLAVMVDPVRTKYGHVFENAALTQHLQQNSVDPLNRGPLGPGDVVKADDIRAAIEQNPMARGIARRDAKIAKRPLDVSPIVMPPRAALPAPLAPAVRHFAALDFEEMGYEPQARMRYQPPTLLQSAGRALRRSGREFAYDPAGAACACCIHGTFATLIVLAGTAPTWGGAAMGALLGLAEDHIARDAGIGLGAGVAVNVAIAGCIYACCCRGR